MAAVELDPLFTKALKLLHSKSKDSAEQLKCMLFDVLSKKTAVKTELKVQHGLNWLGKGCNFRDHSCLSCM